jgi:hypothetical protein
VLQFLRDVGPFSQIDGSAFALLRQEERLHSDTMEGFLHLKRRFWLSIAFGLVALICLFWPALSWMHTPETTVLNPLLTHALDAAVLSEGSAWNTFRGAETGAQSMHARVALSGASIRYRPSCMPLLVVQTCGPV